MAQTCGAGCDGGQGSRQAEGSPTQRRQVNFQGPAWSIHLLGAAFDWDLANATYPVTNDLHVLSRSARPLL